MTTYVHQSEETNPHKVVENLLQIAVENLRLASHKAMALNESKGHAIAQVIFITGMELEGWQKKFGKELA